MAAIAAGVAVFNAAAGSLPAGKALPVAKARLKVGDVLDESKPVGPQDKEGVSLSLATCATTGIMTF